jgi:hypothetical protein
MKKASNLVRSVVTSANVKEIVNETVLDAIGNTLEGLITQIAELEARIAILEKREAAS